MARWTEGHWKLTSTSRLKKNELSTLSNIIQPSDTVLDLRRMSLFDTDLALVDRALAAHPHIFAVLLRTNRIMGEDGTIDSLLRKWMEKDVLVDVCGNAIADRVDFTRALSSRLLENFVFVAETHLEAGHWRRLILSRAEDVVLRVHTAFYTDYHLIDPSSHFLRSIPADSKHQNHREIVEECFFSFHRRKVGDLHALRSSLRAESVVCEEYLDFFFTRKGVDWPFLAWISGFIGGAPSSQVFFGSKNMFTRWKNGTMGSGRRAEFKRKASQWAALLLSRYWKDFQRSFFDMEERRKKLKRTVEDLKEEFDRIPQPEQFKATDGEQQEFRLLHADVATKLNNLSSEPDVESATEEIRARIGDLQTRINKICIELARVQRDRDEKVKKLREKHERLAEEKEEQMKKLTEEGAEKEKQMKKLTEKHERLVKECAERQEQVKKLREEKKQLPSVETDGEEEVKKLREDHERLAREQAEKEEEVKKLKEELERLAREQAEKEEEVKTLKEELAREQAEKEEEVKKLKEELEILAREQAEKEEVVETLKEEHKGLMEEGRTSAWIHFCPRDTGHYDNRQILLLEDGEEVSALTSTREDRGFADLLRSFNLDAECAVCLYRLPGEPGRQTQQQQKEWQQQWQLVEARALKRLRPGHYLLVDTQPTRLFASSLVNTHVQVVGLKDFLTTACGVDVKSPFGLDLATAGAMYDDILSWRHQGENSFTPSLDKICNWEEVKKFYVQESKKEEEEPKGGVGVPQPTSAKFSDTAVKHILESVTVDIKMTARTWQTPTATFLSISPTLTSSFNRSDVFCDMWSVEIVSEWAEPDSLSESMTDGEEDDSIEEQPGDDDMTQDEEQPEDDDMTQDEEQPKDDDMTDLKVQISALERRLEHGRPRTTVPKPRSRLMQNLLELEKKREELLRQKLVNTPKNEKEVELDISRSQLRQSVLKLGISLRSSLFPLHMRRQSGSGGTFEKVISPDHYSRALALGKLITIPPNRFPSISLGVSTTRGLSAKGTVTDVAPVLAPTAEGTASWSQTQTYHHTVDSPWEIVFKKSDDNAAVWTGRLQRTFSGRELNKLKRYSAGAVHDRQSIPLSARAAMVQTGSMDYQVHDRGYGTITVKATLYPRTYRTQKAGAHFWCRLASLACCCSPAKRCCDACCCSDCTCSCSCCQKGFHEWDPDYRAPSRCHLRVTVTTSLAWDASTGSLKWSQGEVS